MLGRRRRSHCRPSKYSREDDEDGLAKLSSKLTSDLRKHIRELKYAAPLTDIWCMQLPHMKRVADVADLESTLPKTEENCTLWEGEELALRFLLEDGKMNLVLRMLNDAKVEQIAMRAKQHGGASLSLGAESKDASDGVSTSTERSSDGQHRDEEAKVGTAEESKTERDAAASDAVAGAGLRAAIVGADSLNEFEESCGRLLNRAWEHIEALQTTDMPLVCAHLSMVLRAAVETAPSMTGFGNDVETSTEQEAVRFSEFSQEALLLNTFAILMRAVQDGLLEEHRCLPWVRKEGCVAAVIHHLAVNHERIGQYDVAQGLAALSALFGTEDYAVFEDKYLPTDADKAALVALQPSVRDVSNQGSEEKRALRRLADEISTMKRATLK
jgi:hypothetical protein